MIVILILLLAAFNTVLFDFFSLPPAYYQLDAYTWESAPFRAMELGPGIAALETIDPEQLAALMLEHDYDLTECTDLSYDNKILLMRKPEAYRKLANAYQAVLSDLKYFPVPKSQNPDTPAVTYEDGWQQPRTYGGERGHEGCDIMGDQRERGFYPVISMSDGVVEKIGWLEQGGWRLGIRTESGAYLYYAHLFSYSRDWKEGDRVKAGQLLGFMGDSGYGKEENTVGNFPVHLHVGIYLKTDHHEELSVNPYWILKYLEKWTLSYSEGDFCAAGLAQNSFDKQ